MKFGGLTHDEALKLVTIIPPRSWGLISALARSMLEKDATALFINHDPLSAYAVAQKTIIDGRVSSIATKTSPDARRLKKRSKICCKEKRRGEKVRTRRNRTQRKPGT